MCKVSVSCPLCSHSTFTSIAALRLSLIKAIDSPIACPICQETVMGLDKLTLHLISHNGIINSISTTLSSGNNNNNNMNFPSIRNHSDRKIEKFLKKNINLLDTPAHAFYFKNEPLELISPVLLASQFIPASSISTLPLPIESSHMLPSVDRNFSVQSIAQLQTNSSLVQLNKSAGGNQNKTFIIEHIPIDSNLKINNNNNENSLMEKCDKHINKSLETSLEDTIRPDEPKCDLCGLTFRTFEVFKKHIKIMHQLTVKAEDICTSQNNNLKLSNFTNQYPCHLCSKSYKMQARLRLHLKVKHSLGIPISINNDENNDGGFHTPKLNICQKIRLMNSNIAKAKLERNENKSIDSVKIETTSKITPKVSTQTNNNNKNNKNCAGTTNSDVNSASDTHNAKTEAIPKPWKCDVCSKFYTTKYFLKKHKRIHTGETPYKCSICNKSFTFQQSYHKHLLYHSDDKPHVCKTCNRAFKELSTLHNHERIHSGEKPFECEICGKKFRQRVSNYVHQRTHTGVKPYFCEICHKRFRYKVTLRTHKCNLASLLNELPNETDPIKQESSDENSNHLLTTNTGPKSKVIANSELETMTSTVFSMQTEDNLQKLLQSVNILPELPSNSITTDCHTDESKAMDMNEEMASKSIDDIVAESCNKLGIGTSNNCDGNFNNTTNSVPSPSEQLQQLCLYSPTSMEDNLNVALSINEDSLKQLLFEIENSKDS